MANYDEIYFSLPQEDSDYERERTPPTPPPRKYSRRGASFKLGCIGKQDSDENPLMRKVATPLKLAQAQVPMIVNISFLLLDILLVLSVPLSTVVVSG